MKLRSVLVLGMVLLFGTVAFAQDYAKVEVPMYYSFMRFNPENSNVVSGFSMNGGGGGGNVVGSGDMFTYEVGPVLKYRGEKWEPFVETLFGGAHSNTYNNLFHDLC